MMRNTKQTKHYLQMHERDYLILQSIAQCGGLTSEQINRRYFPSIPVVPAKIVDSPPDMPQPRIVIHSNCQRRMLQLYQAGYLRRIERYQRLSEGKLHYLYALTLQGAEVLAAFLDCTPEATGWRKMETRLRPNYIDHLIHTNDVRLAFERAVSADTQYQIVQWQDELSLVRQHQHDVISFRFANGSIQQVRLNPDAYLLLREPNQRLRHYFLEIDRGTEAAESSDETYRSWYRKVKTYIGYISPSAQTGTSLFEARYKAKRPLILVVTTSERRQKRLMEVTEKAGGGEIFFFTTHSAAIEPVICSNKQNKTLNGHTQEVTTFVAKVPNILLDTIWSSNTQTGIRTHPLV